MKFNTKFLYALMAAGLILPTASVQAWPWKWGGTTPLIQKVQEKATEEVKKEASKSAADYAVAGAKVVGKAAGTVALNAAKEVGGYAGSVVSKAAERPIATVAVIGTGIWAYRNWDKVKQAYDQAKKVAQVAVPLAGAVVAGKVTMDAYNAYKQLFGTQQGSSNLSAQNNNASKQAPAPQANKVSQSEKQKLDEQEAKLWDELWNDYEQAEQKAATPVVVSTPVITPAETAVFEQAFAGQPVSHKSDILERAQARVKGLTFQEVREMDKAWEQASKETVVQNNEQKVQAETSVQQAPVNMVPRLAMNDPESRAMTAELIEQFSPRSNERFDPLVLIQEERADILARAQERIKQQHPWVQEFSEYIKEEEAKEAAQQAAQHPLLNQWTKEYKNNNAMERAAVLARHLVDSLEVDDETENIQEDAHRDTRARIMYRDMIQLSNRVQPGCAPSRVPTIE